MHWGERRYQNEDGSLTPAGRARYGVQERAAGYAKKMAKRSLDNAKYYSDSNKDIKKRYLTDGGRDRYAEDNFGYDTKTEAGRKQLMDEFGDGSYKDYESFMDAFMKNDIKEMTSHNSKMAEQYRKEADNWLKKSDKLLNTPVDKISKADFKEAKKLARKDMTPDEIKAERKEKLKKAAIIGGAVVGTALVAYGGYKASQFIKYKGMANRKVAADVISRATKNADAMATDQLGIFGQKGAKDQAKFDKYFNEFSTKYTKEAKGQATKLAKQAVKDETKYAKDYVNYIKDKHDPYAQMFGPINKPRKSNTIKELNKYSKKSLALEKAISESGPVIVSKKTGKVINVDADDLMKKKSTGPLSFGGSNTSSNSNERLNNTLSQLSKIAQSSDNSDLGRDLAEELLRKNKGKL